MESPKPTQLIAIKEGYRKLRNLLKAAKVEIEAPGKEGTGESTVMTPQPLRSGSDFGDTSSRSSRGQVEDSFSEGGSLNVTAPGMGLFIGHFVQKQFIFDVIK